MLKDVRHILDLNKNLISASKLDDEGNMISFHKKM